MDLTTKVFSILHQVEDLAFAKELFQVIGSYSQSFLKTRTQNYIFKIAKAKQQIKENLENSLETKRNICFKLFSVKFNSQDEERKVLGILFALNFLSEYEQFKRSHLFQVIRNLVPGTSILEDSFYMVLDEKKKHLICYCEIEKFKGKNISLEETTRLKKLFSQEIFDNINRCSPDLWMPKNEEQIIKDAIRLNKEITSIKDLPHVVVLFKDQQFASIRFNVIIVRIIKNSSPALKHAFSGLDHEVEVDVERIEFFSNKYKKETLVLSWKISNALFYRKNHAIDVLKARQYICMTIEHILGEFRDYNGALLAKQTEQFNFLVESSHIKTSDLSDFEDLFYSLSPTNIQLLVPMEKALEISKDFYDLKKHDLKEPFIIRFKKHERLFFVIIKTSSDIYDSVFSDFPKDPLVAKTSKKIGENTYHFLIQVNPSTDFSPIKFVRKKLLLLKSKKKKVSRKEVRINFQEGVPTSFHPHLNGDVKTFTVCKALYDGLVRIDPKGNAQLSVAKDVKVSLCQRKYIFTLRDSKWSNGMRVTSYHFARAWKKGIFSRKNGRNPIGSRHLFLIKNAEQIVNKELPMDALGIHTPDSHTLVVELNCSHPFFLHLLATIPFSPLYGEDLDKEPSIFNGPFVPTVYSDDKIELRKNEYYWDVKSVNLEKISIFFQKDPNKIDLLFQQGQLDWIGSPFNSPAKKGRESIQTYKTNYPFWFFCNTKHQKLKSLNIRKALYLSIDRGQLIEKVLPLQKPLYGVIPDEFSTINARDLFAKNPKEKARLLFKKGLKEIGYLAKDFTLTIHHSDFPDHKQLAEFSKKCWEEVLGIQVKLLEVSWNSYYRDLMSLDFEIGGAYITCEHNHALALLSFFSNHQNNFSRWECEKYNHLLSDKNLSENSLKKAEQILMKNLPVIPISDHTEGLFMGALKNFVFPKFGYADFKWVEK